MNPYLIIEEAEEIISCMMPNVSPTIIGIVVNLRYSRHLLWSVTEVYIQQPEDTHPTRLNLYRTSGR